MNNKNSRTDKKRFFNWLFHKQRKSYRFQIDINDPVIVELSRKTKTRNEIATEYKVSVKVLNRWFIEKNLIIPQGLICPGDLRIIYATLGIPDVSVGIKR